MLAKNATLGSEIDEGIPHVLPSFVIMQNLDLLLALVLSKGLECLNGLEALDLALRGMTK